ncbi:MAG: low temperature requirement protein A [Polyangia bacterium]
MSGHSSPEPKVSPVELFFDLVFVYAITQVTTLLLSDLSPLGFVRSGLALFMIWWAWSLYTWMANAIGPSGRKRPRRRSWWRRCRRS